MAGSLEKIEKLFQLKERGIITSDEFALCKEKLLNVNETTSLKESFNQMKQNYRSYWKNTFRWHPRATVEEFWEPIIANHIIFGILGILNTGLSFLFFLMTFFPSLAVLVRRIHDLGKSAGYVLIPFFLFFLFVIGMFFSSIFMATSTFEIGIFAVMIICGIGAIWTLCATMNRIWFVTARMGENKSNQYGEPRA